MIMRRRYEAAAGNPAILIETVGAFASLALSRTSEPAPVSAKSIGVPWTLSAAEPEAAALSNARVPTLRRPEVRIPSAPRSRANRRDFLLRLACTQTLKRRHVRLIV